MTILFHFKQTHHALFSFRGQPNLNKWAALPADPTPFVDSSAAAHKLNCTLNAMFPHLGLITV